MSKKIKQSKRSAGDRQKKEPAAGGHGLPAQQNMFQQAVILHQAGRLPQAEALYRQILLIEPNHPDALHYLGILVHQMGNNEIAVELISKALSCKPDYVDAHINLGNTLKALGKLDEAVASFRQALSLKPDNALVHYNLGNALKVQGKLDEAVACYGQALTLKPDDAVVHYNLGNTFKDQGKLNEAVVSYRRALTLMPDNAEIHNNLGITLNDQGNLDEAVASFRRALKLKPNDPVTHFNLGNTLKDQGKLNEAVTSYRRSLTLKPDNADAYNNLGITLKDLGKLDEAVASLRQALTLKPDNAELHNNLGKALNDLNKLDEAVASFRRVLTLKPDYAEAHFNLGLIFGELGRMDDAIACFRKALSLKPDYAKAYKNLSTIVKYTEVNDVVRAMEGLYNRKGDIPDADRIDLGFSLGKIFDDLGDYDKAFDFILEANLLKRRSYKYSIHSDQNLFERIKKTFSPDFFASHYGSGHQDRTPIFILGMPRSGTTLVEQILASHPLVFGAGELGVLENLINDICTGGATAPFPECMLDLGWDALERMGSGYIEKIREYTNDAEYITDKLPNNFLRVGLIKTILPNAKVIHCMRNPMDNCYSIFKTDFTGTHGYAYDMVELGQYYNLYGDLIAHWDKVLPGFMYTLRYEEMVADQQNQTEGLLDFCGLPWDEACLAFHKTKRRVETASLSQVRHPIYKDSVELWKQYEKQLEPLRKAIYG